MPSPALHGVILLGHGSREPATETEIRELSADLSARFAGAPPARRVAHAFLNQEPRLETAAEALVAAGCTRVRIVPLLVFTGRHLIDDVPAALDALRARHPGVVFSLTPHLYRLPGFSDLIAETANTAEAADSTNGTDTAEEQSA